MFERYTETARKAIFVARNEASQFGSEYIETEHLLLGMLRADSPLAMRLLKPPASIESIREQVEKQFVRPPEDFHVRRSPPQPPVQTRTGKWGRGSGTPEP